MEYLITFLVLVKSHPIISFFVLLGVGVLGMYFSIVLPRSKVDYLVIPLFGLYMMNLFAGHLATNFLLEHFGEKGQGMVIDSSQTSDSYNDQPVWRYDVMLKSGNEAAASTYFLTSDFNIIHMESFNEFYYPAAGVKFNVLYLKKYPRAFVIIADDDSEYAKSLQKGKVLKEIQRLKNQLKMEPQNTELAQKLKQLEQENSINSD